MGMGIDQGFSGLISLISAMAILVTCMLSGHGIGTSMGAQPNQWDIPKGKAIYEDQCIECHGRKGDGKGPTGYFLATRPADFHAVESRSKNVEELTVIIQQGTLFDEMHGWDNELSPQDILDVIGYIRTLAPSITPKP